MHVGVRTRGFGVVTPTTRLPVQLKKVYNNQTF